MWFFSLFSFTASTALFFLCLGMSGTVKSPVHFFTAVSGGLPNNEITFAEIAKKAGYATGLVGNTFCTHSSLLEKMFYSHVTICFHMIYCRNKTSIVLGLFVKQNFMLQIRLTRQSNILLKVPVGSKRQCYICGKICTEGPSLLEN